MDLGNVDLLETRIETMGDLGDLCARARTRLADIGVRTLGDLANKSEKGLVNTRRFSPIVMDNIREALERYGLSFRQE